MGSPPPDPQPGAARPPHDFEASYASETPPWDIGRPQPAFARLARAGGLQGRVLDVGCGTGEHAMLAASLGHEAVGIDIAPVAIERARAKAAARDLSVRFIVSDALALPELGLGFDTVLDCGLFHLFDDADRARFVASLTAALPVGGRYHLLCFSDREPGDWGPRRVTQAEIRESLADGWAVDSIEPDRLEIRLGPGEAHAWLVGATRV